MKRPAGWEKRILITLFITFSLIFMIQTSAMAFGPQIVDVTTKAFSVVWTTGGTYTSCGINLYTSNTYSTQKTLDPSQIIIETDPNEPGEAGKQYGIAKVTVVGLNVDTDYYFRLKQNGSLLSGNYSVTTAKLRGFESTDPNDSDIVSNDIVHKAVYKPDGTSPATGALVLAHIYEYNVDPESAPGNTKSYYPVSAWLGDGMIGNEDDNVYNPNNISYKQYAALNMNNLFEKATHYPLSLNGDDPDTSANDSEIIKFIIVHGTQSMLGGSTDTATSYGRVEYVEKSGGEKITTAKVSASFKFIKGLNMFTFPFSAPENYTTGDLLLDIEEAEGVTKIVEKIYIYKGGWEITQRGLFGISNSLPLAVGDGCFIQMKSNMTKELIFYGKPNSVKVDMSLGLNLVAFPQTPVNYETADLLLDAEAPGPVGGGAGTKSVQKVYFYDNGWDETKRGLFGISNSKVMTNEKFYFVSLTNGNVDSWDPWELLE